MGRSFTTIMDGDEMFDIEASLVKTCGLDFNEYLRNKSILTKEIFELHFDKVMEVVNERSYHHFVYHVLAYLILKIGASLPDDIKKKIIDSTDFEKYEKNYWDSESWTSKDIEDRKFYLNDLKKKIIHYKRGKTTSLADESFSN